MRIVSFNRNTTHHVHPAFGGYPVQTTPASARRQPVLVLTDDMVKAMFARSNVYLNDGVVPVEAEIIGWQRTSVGCLGAIVLNKLAGARFLFGPDLAKGGNVPKLLARLT